MPNPFNQNVPNEIVKVFSPQEYLDFQTLINTKCLTLKECGFSSRNYEYNKKWGLVLSAPADDDTDKKKWVRPSIREFIWLKILERCRTFGLEKDRLKDIKTSILDELDLAQVGLDSDFMDMVIKNYQPMWEKESGAEYSQQYTKFLKTVGLKGLFKVMKISMNVLDYFLFMGLNTRCNTGFTITDDGVFNPYMDNKIMSAEFRISQHEQLFTKHFMFINLWDILIQIPSLESAPGLLKKMIISKSSNRGQDIDLRSKYFVTEEMKKTLHKNESYVIIKDEQLSPKKAIIEKVAYEYTDQDILIKIRDRQKVSIKRTVYKKEKGK